MENLPYDVVIDTTGVWYGPADTPVKSRDWMQWTNGIASFFDIITRHNFVLNVTTWRVRGI